MKEDTPSPSAVNDAPQWDQITEVILCPLCDYNLRGISEPRCPECGYRFAWPELMEAARRSHPTLFDHNPRRKLRNFFLTLRGGLSPATFWRSIHPALACSRRRLLLYLVLYMLPWLLLLAVAFAGQAMRYESRVAANRASLVASWSMPQNAQVAKMVVATYGSLQAAAANAYYPPWWHWRTLVHFLPALWGPGGLLLAPAGTLLGLLIFQASMRRARIKMVHVLRCVIYSYDIFLVAGLAVVAIAQLASLLGGVDSVGAIQVFSERGIFAHRHRPLLLALSEYAFWLILVVACIRLWRAYQLYLRFDHPFWTVLCVQLIVVLLYATLMVNGIL